MTTRLTRVLLTAIYISLFYFIYERWGQKYYYLGLSYEPSLTLVIIAVSLCLMYSFLEKSSHNNIGSFIFEVHFIIVILPAILVIVVQDYPVWQRLSLLLGLLGAQLLFRLMVIVSAPKLTAIQKVNPRTIRFLAISVTIILLVYMVYVYAPYLSFVSLDNVHEHRALVSLVVSAPMIGYVVGFLQTAAAPVLVAVGIHKSRWSLVFLGAVIMIVVYMALGSKIALAQLLFTAMFSFWVRRTSIISVIPIYFLFVSLLAITAVIIAYGWIDQQWGNEFAALVFMRSFAIQGAQLGVYYDFFLQNPNTYYSHIGFLSDTLDYPYRDSLGITIGNFLGTAGTMNANAGVWATDGIAAANILGLFIAAILFGIFVIFIKATLPSPLVLMFASAILPFIMSTANGSLFTNLLTGGGIFLTFCIRYVASERSVVAKGSR